MWICRAPRRDHTSKRSGMARVLKGSHSFTCTPRVHPLGSNTTLNSNPSTNFCVLSFWQVHWLSNASTICSRNHQIWQTRRLTRATADRAKIYEQRCSASYHSNSGSGAVSEDKVRSISGFWFLNAVC